MRVVFAILILFSFSCQAQTKKELTISYGEKINLGRIDAQTEFLISSEYGTSKIKGEKLNDYIFSKPGMYQIKIEESNTHKHGDCNHSRLPNLIMLNVSRIKMIFDGTQLTFSEPITKNKNTEGIAMYIPVVIESYDGMPIPLNFSPVTTSGIGSSITASLDNKVKELSVGNHILKYTLSGLISESSYIMFDFIDANSNIQSISLLTPITN